MGVQIQGLDWSMYKFKSQNPWQNIAFIIDQSTWLKNWILKLKYIGLTMRKQERRGKGVTYHYLRSKEALWGDRNSSHLQISEEPSTCNQSMNLQQIILIPISIKKILHVNSSYFFGREIQYA